MSDSTRRTFLVTAGAGAAAVGVAAIAPAAQASAPKAPVTGAGSPGGEPMVAYVSNPGRGELTLLVGEREVLVTDRDLVARLARAAAS